MINFHESYLLKNSIEYIEDVLNKGMVAGDGTYTDKCQKWLENKLASKNILMTTSCTHALELALQVIELKKDDEVIMPSFTFPSTANAVLMAGANVVYSEIELKHLTIDPDLIEEKITSHTKAILVVHYGGICCDMDKIMDIAMKYNLIVIEDGAQSFLSKYKDRFAGTIGHFGCLSFHGTKDVVSGEGGALIVNAESYYEKCRIFRQKGTNRDAFFDGKVNFYEWVSKGSSYTPSDILMALLFGQLEMSSEIIKHQKRLFNIYENFFNALGSTYLQTYSRSSDNTEYNGHLFYIVFYQKDMAIRFKDYLKTWDIQVRTHFIPLHESRMGRQYIRPVNHFRFEEGLGQRLIRLPLYGNLTIEDIKGILLIIKDFFEVCP